MEEPSYFTKEQELFLSERRNIYQWFKLLKDRADSGDYSAWQMLQDYQFHAKDALDSLSESTVKGYQKRHKLEHESFTNVTGWLNDAVRAISAEQTQATDRERKLAPDALAFATATVEDWKSHFASLDDWDSLKISLKSRWQSGALLLPKLCKDSAGMWAAVVVDYWEADCGGDWKRSALSHLLDKNTAERAEIGSRSFGAEARSQLKWRFRQALKTNPERFL